MSECAEVKEAWVKGDREHLEEEMGDLLNAAVCLAIFCGLDPEKTLVKSTEKYQKRLDKVMELVKRDGLENLRGKPIEVLLGYWKKAKVSEK